jgi:hypothetical protein
MKRSDIFQRVRRYRFAIAGAVFLAVCLIGWRLLSGGQAASEASVVPEEVRNDLVKRLTDPTAIIPDGDTTVDKQKKSESVENDIRQIREDAQKDKNVEKSCEEILAEYKAIVEDLLAHNYESSTFEKYNTFGMIKGADGTMRPGPKLGACKQDSAFLKAFDEIDKRLTNGN